MANDFLDDSAVSVGQPKIVIGVFKRQTFVIESEWVQERCVQIGHVDASFVAKNEAKRKTGLLSDNHWLFQ